MCGQRRQLYREYPTSFPSVFSCCGLQSGSNSLKSEAFFNLSLTYLGTNTEVAHQWILQESFFQLSSLSHSIPWTSLPGLVPLDWAASSHHWSDIKAVCITIILTQEWLVNISGCYKSVPHKWVYRSFLLTSCSPTPAWLYPPLCFGIGD